MTLWQHYVRPETVQQALEALASASDPSCPIAGGTDLMLDLQQGNHSPVHTLVDITGIPEMRVIELRGGELFIGAGVPHSQIVASALVNQHAPALVEACGLIGGPQVRNMATLGGNVAHALPAADGTIALTALAAKAEVATLSTRRLLLLNELFLGPGKSALQPKVDLLSGFYLPLQAPREYSAFRRVMRAQGIALPILNLAAWVSRDGDTIRAARVAIGPAGPTPFRAKQTEAFLQGKLFGESTLDSALEVLLGEATFRTSPRRATAEYRRELVIGLFRDALTAAWERALE